jgi:hypothetical protein
MPGARLFDAAETAPGKRRALAEQASARFPQAFRRPEEAQEYLGHVFLPASLRWAYCGNGKTGATSTKRVLFELEFGHPLTASLRLDTDMNSDPAPHFLKHAGVFRPVLWVPNGLDVLERALRLTTARHPTTRALSSFTYLCRSDEAAHPWLADERMRMNAVTGFDWTGERHTATGFLKFLDYLAAEAEADRLRTGDPHLRPQVLNVRPEVLRPELVGRTERLDAFFRALAERLGRPLPERWKAPHSNRQDPVMAETLLTPAAMGRLASVFAADYEWLGETPQSWRQE